MLEPNALQKAGTQMTTPEASNVRPALSLMTRASTALRRAAGVVGAPLFLLALTNPAAVRAGSAPATERLILGDYRLEGPGTFRRIIVSERKIVSYDIWQAAPGGKIRSLHFSLVSPVYDPIESESYQVRSSGKTCGDAGLHFYRDATGTFREFLVFRYSGVEAPFSWGGHPPTSKDLTADQREVAKVLATAHDPSFYHKLDAKTLDMLSQGIPRCN